MRHAIFRAGILPAVIAALAVSAAPAHGVVFTNPAPITINDNGVASPYPSAIGVSGLSGTITDVNVTLFGFSHTFPADVGVALTGPPLAASGWPDGVWLMANAGGGADVSGVNTTFDGDASQGLPGTAWPSGSYFSQYGCESPKSFPAPAPTHPAACTSGSLDAALLGFPPNGIWNLFVIDSEDNADTGSISGGWSIDITAGGPPLRNLTVIKSGPGANASFTSQPAGVACSGTTCAGQFRNGSLVYLEVPWVDPSVGFIGGNVTWTGCDSVSGFECLVAMNSDRTVYLDINPPGQGGPGCAGKKATKAGGPGANRINGTAGRDVIDAGGGKDTVSGKGGNDLICGGSGKDRLKGGTGNDRLEGQEGADILRGGAGKDRLNGDEGRDSCAGGPGKDTTASC